MVDILKKEITSEERLLLTVCLGEVDRLPVIQPLQTGTIELMNQSGIYWPEAHKTADKMAGLSYAAHSIIGFESVRIPFDINVEAEALGCTLDWKRWDMQPPIKAPAISSPDMIDQLEVPDPTKTARMPTVIEATGLLSSKVKAEGLPVIVGIVGPFMIAGQVRGVEQFLIEVIKRPDLAHKLLKVSTQTCIEYVKEVEKAGASAITIVDATSSPDLISPRHYDAFSKPYVEDMIRNSKVPNILHICGKTRPILDRMVSTGAKVVSVDSSVDMADLKRAAAGKCATAGNVSVVGSLFLGTPDEVAEETRTVIAKGVDIPCTSCGIAPPTTMDNLKAMVSAIRRYGGKK